MFEMNLKAWHTHTSMDLCLDEASFVYFCVASRPDLYLDPLMPVLLLFFFINVNGYHTMFFFISIDFI